MGIHEFSIALIAAITFSAIMETTAYIPIISSLTPDVNLTVGKPMNFTNLGTTPAFNLSNRSVFEGNMDNDTSTYRSIQKSPAEKAALLYSDWRVLSCVFYVVGIFLNVMSIAAICHIPNERPPHATMIISLAVSDTLINVGILCQDMISIFSYNYCISSLIKNFCLFTTLIATLLNLLLIAADHFIAIFKPLAYKTIMSKTRCRILIVTLWVVSVLGGLTDIFVAMAGSNGSFHICDTRLDDYHMSQPLIAISGIVLSAIFVIYFKIYCRVRTMQAEDRQLHQDGMHNSKALFIALLVTFTFVIFWLPLIICLIVENILLKYYFSVVDEHFELLFDINNGLFILMQVNTVVDPLIYACRLRSVQLGYMMLYRKICRCRNARGFRACTTNNLDVFVSHRRDTAITVHRNSDSIAENDQLSQLLASNSVHCDMHVKYCSNPLIKEYDPNGDIKSNGLYKQYLSAEADLNYETRKQDVKNSVESMSGEICIDERDKYKNEFEDKCQQEDETDSNHTEFVTLSPTSDDLRWSPL